MNSFSISLYYFQRVWGELPEKALGTADGLQTTGDESLLENKARCSEKNYFSVLRNSGKYADEITLRSPTMISEI